MVIASTLGMEKPPEKYESVGKMREQRNDLDLLKVVKEYMGDDEVAAVSVGTPSLGKIDRDIFCLLLWI